VPPTPPAAPANDRILAETKYLRLVDRNGWFFVERPFASGVVVLVATTAENNLVLVEQHRPALGQSVIELPAGLAGDEAGHESEPLEAAARRELLEETGYDAANVEPITTCASGPGLTSEIITFFRATGLRKVGKGGGVAAEDITVLEVPLPQAHAWLLAKTRAGAIVATKVWAGLWFAHQA
jgi:ADP-ribose pyrophosphatase